MSSEWPTEAAYHGADQPAIWAVADGYSEAVLQRSFAFYRCQSTANQPIYLAIELYQGDVELLQQQEGIAAAIKKALLFDQADQNLDASGFRKAVRNGDLAIVFCSRQGAEELFDEESLWGGMSQALVTQHLSATVCPAVLAMLRQPYIKRSVWQEMQKFMAQYAG